mgnify:CR=1 FL=1
MKMKVYTDVDKVFTCGQFSITRQDFEILPCLMLSELCDDETMQKIVDDVCKCMEDTYTKEELEMYRKFRNYDSCNLTLEEKDYCNDMEDYEFAITEKTAIHYGMRYWDDLSEEEQDYLIKNYNF